MTAVVIGVGNRYRRDDGVGPAVVAQLEALQLAGVTAVEHDGEPAGLLDLWSGFPIAVVVDAVHSHLAPPGHVHRVEVDERASTPHGVPGRAAEPKAGPPASHGLGPGDAVALARVLHRLPDRLVIFGIEGEDFAPGLGLSPPVRNAIEPVITAIRAILVPNPTGEVEDREQHDGQHR